MPGFGTQTARLLAVGLAPGAHGSNRTGTNVHGRRFRGLPLSGVCFGLVLPAARALKGLATVCACWTVHHGDLPASAPPGNKPMPEEIRACRGWLQAEMDCLAHVEGIVLLGKIALDGVLALPMYAGLRRKELPFRHGAFYAPAGLPWLLCSYHPSRQNTQTGRLTPEMLDAIWQKAGRLLDGSRRDVPHFIRILF